jgi:hypothetical protein
MPIADYPITRINTRSPALTEGGWTVWSWQLAGPAYDSPLEPLTQEFWQAERNERLDYGIVLFSFDAQVQGDLLVFATRSLDRAPNPSRFSHLTVPEQLAMCRLLLKLNVPHVNILRSIRSGSARLALHRDLESVFDELVRPRRWAGGGYYRRLSKLEAVDPAQADNLGVGHCPRCKQMFTFTKGMDIRKAYRMDVETVFILGTCTRCRKVVVSAINPHFANPLLPL